MEPEPRNNIEAEYALIGSLLIDPEMLDEVLPCVLTSDFYRDAHRIIYDIILQLYAQHIPADSITIVDELERVGKLNEIGGPGYIAGMINHVPTSGNAVFYARLIANRALSRRLMHAAAMIAAIAQTGDEDMLFQAEKVLYEVESAKRGATTFLPMSQIMLNYFSSLETRTQNPGKLSGIPTGLSAVDDALQGLQRGDLIIACGRPGSGKTSFAMALGINAGIAGMCVAVFSLEMNGDQLATRALAMDAKLDTQNLRAGWISDFEWERVTSSIEKLSGLPLWISDASGELVDTMRSKLQRLKHEIGRTPDLIIVDYLQLVTPGDEKALKVHQIGEISKKLKALAKECNAAVLCLAQLSRTVESRSPRVPIMSDLRDSGNIEENADIILALYRPAFYAAQKLEPEYTEMEMHPELHELAQLFVLKNRMGEVGDVKLRFHGPSTHFTDWVESD